MKPYLLVGCGGMLGSMLRYFCGTCVLAWMPGARFPWGTFFVNIFGCFLIGISAAAIERMTSLNAEARLLVITGFLGGFTTFSAFGIETVTLVKNGFAPLAVIYVLASVVVGMAGVYMGLKLTV